MKARPSLDEIFAAPEDAPQAQSARPSLDEIFAQPAQPAQVVTPEPGFFAQQRQRGAESANLDQQAAEGNYSQPVSQLHKLGQLGAGVNDAIGTVAGSAYNTLMTDKGKQNINAQAQRIAATPVGQAGIAALQKGGEIWDTYKQANPQTADILGSAVNIGTAAMGLGGIGNAAGAIGDIAGEGGQKVAQISAETASDIAKKLKTTPLPTSADIKDLAQKSYKLADETGGTLSPEFANKLYDSVDAMKPQTEHGMATVGQNALAGLAEDWKTLRDKPVTLQAAQEMDEGLSQRIDKHVDKVTGKLDKEGAQLYDVQSQFRNMIDEAKPEDITGGKEGFDALNQGRSLWSTSLRVGDMERILTRAQMTDNPATSIKTGFRTLYNNPSRMRGYNDAEKAAIKKAAESGVIGDTLRTVIGSRLLSLVGGSVGGGAPGALLSVPISAASRAVATGMQAKRANNAIRTVAQRIPKDIAKLPPREALKAIGKK